MYKIVIIIFLTLTALGCSRKIAPVAEVRDITFRHVEERVHDTFIELIPDSALIRALLACDSLGNVYLQTINSLQGERVRQHINLTDNILEVTATDYARQRHYTHHTGETIVRYKEIPVPVEVNRLSTWQAFQVWTGRIAMILIILFAVWRMIKVRLNRIIKPFKSY